MSIQGSKHRRSIHLPGYDYTHPGAYYITICSWNRELLFGEIKDEKMILNKFGEIVEDEWMRTFSLRPDTSVDAFAVMPNHIHGIILLTIR